MLMTELNLKSLPSLSLGECAQLPPIPAIYFAIDSQGKVQYIGKSVNIQQRWTQHHRATQLKTLGEIRIAYLQTEPDLLDEVEQALIKQWDPLLNRSPVPGTKKPRIVFYLEESLKHDLEKLAEVENRSVSNLIETVARELVAKAKKEGKIDAD